MLAFLGAGLAVGLLIARLVGRRRPSEAGAEPDPRAEALREKLAASREEAPSPAGPAAAEPGVDEARRRVHERGRAAIEQMRGGQGTP